MQNRATASCVTAAMLTLAATNGARAAEPPLACEIVVSDEGGGAKAECVAGDDRPER